MSGWGAIFLASDWSRCLWIKKQPSIAALSAEGQVVARKCSKRQKINQSGLQFTSSLLLLLYYSGWPSKKATRCLWLGKGDWPMHAFTQSRSLLWGCASEYVCTYVCRDQSGTWAQWLRVVPLELERERAIGLFWKPVLAKQWWSSSILQHRPVQRNESVLLIDTALRAHHHNK